MQDAFEELEGNIKHHFSDRMLLAEALQSMSTPLLSIPNRPSLDLNRPMGAISTIGRAAVLGPRRREIRHVEGTLLVVWSGPRGEAEQYGKCYQKGAPGLVFFTGLRRTKRVLAVSEVWGVLWGWLGGFGKDVGVGEG